MSKDLRFPIGRFEFDPSAAMDLDQCGLWINDISSFPNRLENVVSDLSTEMLGWRYRPGGWTIQQVIHHCADSHINSFMRFKLALTEEVPVIRPYFEERWAELADASSCDIQSSLYILKGIHHLWSVLLTSLEKTDLQKTYIHPEHGQQFSLYQTIGLYAWHSNHHLAHIRQAIASEGSYGAST